MYDLSDVPDDELFLDFIVAATLANGRCLNSLAIESARRSKIDVVGHLIREAAGQKRPHRRWQRLLEAVQALGGATQHKHFANLLLLESRASRCTSASMALSEPEGSCSRLAELCGNLLAQHKYAGAEPLLRACLRIREKRIPDHWSTFNARSLLGAALLGQQEYAEVESLLVTGYEGMKSREALIPPEARDRLTEALQRLIQYYQKFGDAEDVAKWRAKAAGQPNAAKQAAGTSKKVARPTKPDAAAQDRLQPPVVKKSKSKGSLQGPRPSLRIARRNGEIIRQAPRLPAP